MLYSKSLLLIFISFVISVATHAAEVTTSVPPGKKKRLGIDRSEFMPDERSFGFTATYWAGYDQLEQVEQKTIKHQIGFSGSYSFTKAFSIYSAIGLGYQTYKDNIYKSNDNDSYSQLSNLDVGAVYAFKPRLAWLKTHSNTLNVSLPVSEESRFDQHRGQYSATNFLQTKSWHGFSLSNRLTADFLYNRFKFSIYNDGNLNRDWAFMESLALSYQIHENISAKFGLNIDYTRYLDNTWDMNFGNQASIIASLWGVQLFATMVNRSYPENERLDFGYYDKYRRLYRVGLTYAF